MFPSDDTVGDPNADIALIKGINEGRAVLNASVSTTCFSNAVKYCKYLEDMTSQVSARDAHFDMDKKVAELFKTTAGVQLLNNFMKKWTTPEDYIAGSCIQYSLVFHKVLIP